MSEPQPDAGGLFPGSVGERLRTAREAQRLSLSEVAARTRIPQRHLEAIEAGAFENLPSSTYAVGFVRAYARAVGADEVALARDTRVEVASAGRRAPTYQMYEIADPARTPSRNVVIIASGLALAVLVLALLWFASGMVGRGSPGTGGESYAPPVAAAPPVPAATQPVPAAASQIALVATDDVWVRVHDAGEKSLYLGTMKAGERFDVPASANGPLVDVGRPDKLQVTLNGSAVPPLGDGRRPLKNIPIDAAALAARGTGAATAAPAAQPLAGGGSAAPAAATERPRASTPPRARSSPRGRPSASPTGPENLLPSAFATPGTP